MQETNLITILFNQDLKEFLQMKRKILPVLLAMFIVFGVFNVVYAASSTQYTSTFSFTSGLKGTTRTYYEKNVGINCSNTKVAPVPSGWYKDYNQPVTYDVVLKTGLGAEVGASYNWPMSSSTYCYRWTNANPNKNASFYFQFYGNANTIRSVKDNKVQDYLKITGDCVMLSEE